MEETVAIIILNYNNFEDTINCIESIEKYNSSKIKYFIVDNASTRIEAVPQLDNYLSQKFGNSYKTFVADKHVYESYPYVTFIKNKKNGGYAFGNNTAIRHALADESVGYILVINNDVLFFEDIISGLKNTIKSLPNCGLVSPLLYKRNKEGYDFNCGRLNIKNRELILTYLLLDTNWFGIKKKINDKRKILLNTPSLLKEDYVKIELPSGSCMIATSEVWASINGFDEGTFLYYEENILFKKLIRKGYANYLIPKLGCIHLGASSISKAVSYSQSIRMFESMMYYAFKYAGLNIFEKSFFRLICWINLLAIKISYKIKR